MNKEPLNHLERLLKNGPTSNGCDDDGKNGDMENVQEFMHGKLFGERECVTQLLNEERKCIKISLIFIELLNMVLVKFQ